MIQGEKPQRVWIDFSINDEPAGRIIIVVRARVCNPLAYAASSAPPMLPPLRFSAARDKPPQRCATCR
jgi:hypothetical protein